jgi:hypothetical protein
LKKSGYTLNKPIYITIETDEDVIIASLDDIEAFAYADTEFEAVNGLCEEIIVLYEDLRKNRANLGVLPQKWLNYLEEAITLSGYSEAQGIGLKNAKMQDPMTCT